MCVLYVCVCCLYVCVCVLICVCIVVLLPGESLWGPSFLLSSQHLQDSGQAQDASHITGQTGSHSHERSQDMCWR